MKYARKALIEHLHAARNILELATVKKYQGELADANKISADLPALFVMWDNSRMKKNGPGIYEFSLLVCSENKAFNRLRNADDNMELVSNIMEWLLENTEFTGDNNSRFGIGDGRQGSAEPTADMLVDTLDFTISEISVTVYKWT